MMRSILVTLTVTLGVNYCLLITENSKATAQNISYDLVAQGTRLTLKDLQNATYQIPELGQVKLTNGVFQSGDKSAIVVRMSKQIAIGSLNPNDSADDAATVLWVTHKGAKPSFYLAVVLNQNGQLNNVDTIALNHGFSVKSLAINKGNITVKMLKYGLNDAPCCPSEETSETFFFNASSGNLIPASLGLQLPSGPQVKDVAAPMPVLLNDSAAPSPENEIEIKF